MEGERKGWGKGEILTQWNLQGTCIVYSDVTVLNLVSPKKKKINVKWQTRPHPFHEAKPI